jgi:hypothetical protein
MANVALEIQNNAPRDALRSAAASIPSSFAIALDTVRKLISPYDKRTSSRRDYPGAASRDVLGDR